MKLSLNLLAISIMALCAGCSRPTRTTLKPHSRVIYLEWKAGQRLMTPTVSEKVTGDWTTDIDLLSVTDMKSAEHFDEASAALSWANAYGIREVAFKVHGTNRFYLTDTFNVNQ